MSLQKSTPSRGVVQSAGKGYRLSALVMKANSTKLQQAGLIRYTRVQITALDRVGLEKRSCECYAVVEKEYDRLLPAA